MPRLTLLEMTQDILNDMDSDEVNDISDTPESAQVAQIIETTYYEILNSREWPHLNGLMSLTPSADSNKPTHAQIPEDVSRIEWVKYNVRTSTDTKDVYEPITYMEPEEFLDMLNSRDSSASDVQTVNDPTNIKLFITNDERPRYWTSFDDEWLVFDSFDSDVDSTIQASKLQVWGKREPTFSTTNGFKPDLPAKAFPYLLAEAKSTCFNALRQSANQKEEQKSRRQRVWLARNSWKENGGIRFPDYGRK